MTLPKKKSHLGENQWRGRSAQEKDNSKKYDERKNSKKQTKIDQHIRDRDTLMKLAMAIQ